MSSSGADTNGRGSTGGAARSTRADTDVLIVGAGPVGLALAGDLGWRGVDCLVIDEGDGTIAQPKMTMVGVRTMEFCRRWDIVDWVEASPFPRDRPQDYVYVTSLCGYEYAREPFAPLAEAEPPPQSPEARYRCPQDMFDPILRRHALGYPSVALRYETTLESLSAHDDWVTATVTDAASGRRRELRAKYVVGCDGAQSTVREWLGITMEGPGTLTYTTNVIFRCPELDSLHDKADAYRWVVVGEEGIWATIVAINGRDRFRFSLIGDDQPRNLSAGDLQSAIRRAVGVDRDFEICSVLPWIRKEGVAATYRKGRVLLAGDACHVMSPTGGFGMNTGIGDAVDLSWKLDALRCGWGGEGLLDAYGIERRPVAVRNAKESSANLYRMLETRAHPPAPEVFLEGEKGDAARAALGRELVELMSREWHSIGIQLGYVYETSPLCPTGPTGPAAPTGQDATSYAQSSVPGARAPHVWLDDGRSTLDWYGRGFVLVHTGGDDEICAPIVDAARRQGVPLRVQRSESDAVAAAYERRLVLVRPDGHVAWRSDDGLDVHGAQVLIETVRGASVAGPGPKRALDARTSRATKEAR